MNFWCKFRTYFYEIDMKAFWNFSQIRSDQIRSDQIRAIIWLARLCGTLVSQSCWNICCSISEFNYGDGLFRTRIVRHSACFSITFKTHFSMYARPYLRLHCCLCEAAMGRISDYSVINFSSLKFLQFLDSTNLRCPLGMQFFLTAWMRLWSLIERGYTPE